jgi:hypothetical protein
MQFLRTKIGQLRDYSKTVLGRNRIANSPGDLLEHLLSQPGDSLDAQIHRELGELSRTSERNADISNFIVIKLDDFKYEAASIRKSQKLLRAAIYLLKNGSPSFALDLTNNLETFRNLQALNSKHFDARFTKKAKELDYEIEVIKHRANYIELLLKD